MERDTFRHCVACARCDWCLWRGELEESIAFEPEPKCLALTLFLRAALKMAPVRVCSSSVVHLQASFRVSSGVWNGARACARAVLCLI